MYLNASTDSIEIILGGTVTANQLQWNVSFQDITSSGMTLPQSAGAGLTNNATLVTMVAAPAASTTRQVTNINVYNADTATATVTIRKDVSGTKYVLMRIALTTLDVLMWSRENGWRLMSATGGGTTYTFSTGLTNTSGTVTANLSTGVAGGQSVIGGTAASNNLTLSSTSNATKGKILFGTSAYDEVNNRLGIGTASPTGPLHVDSDITASTNGFILTRSGVSSTDANFQITNATSIAGQFSPSIISTSNFLLSSSTRGFTFIGRITNSNSGDLGIVFDARTKAGASLTQGWITSFDSFVVSYMRISANGNMVLQNGGTFTDAGFRLDVNGTARVGTGSPTSSFLRGFTVSGTTGSVGAGVFNSDTTGLASFVAGESNSNLFGFVKYGSSFAGNFAGSSIAVANSSQFSTGGSNNLPLIFQATPIIFNCGITGTNTAVRLSSGSLHITTLSNAHIDGSFPLDVNGTSRFQNDITISDTRNIILATGTGTKIGTGTTQKLGFWNAAPIAQPTTAVASATRVGGGGTTLTDTDTFDGYTLAQVVKALRNAGLLA